MRCFFKLFYIKFSPFLLVFFLTFCATNVTRKESLQQLDESSRAELVMKALSQAYPDKIGPAEFRDGDWAFKLGEKWYYFAEGRILPEDVISQAEQYSRMSFYGNYPAGIPTWEPPSPEQSARIRENIERRRSGTQPEISRAQFFLNDLWRCSTKEEAENLVKEIKFLGYEVTVHCDIIKELALVEEKIINEAKTNPVVSQWIDSIGYAGAWNWRNIASSPNRSLHSYGIAIDILPKDLEGKETYWLWASERNPEWWMIPYSDRHHPPDEVITIFESFGFVWGGKWMNFDTMHFEYRPEVFILNNIPLHTN